MCRLVRVFIFLQWATSCLAQDIFTVAIISNNRTDSLKRLCDSLLLTHNPQRARIDLLFNMEASSSREVLAYVDGLSWPFGTKSVKLRVVQGGLIRAVLEAWYPQSDRNYGVLLEDDIEVSPLWLEWTQAMLSALRDGRFRHMADRTVGISLYSPKITETVFPKTVFNSKRLASAVSGDAYYPYFMQTPCSWGAVFFPRPWRQFLSYSRHRLMSNSTDRPVLLPGSRTNGWKQSWKKYMFELMWMRGLFLLYPNFPREQSFSTNHMEVGEHVSAADEKKGFTVDLLKDMKLLTDLAAKPVRKVALLDYFGKPFLRSAALERRVMAAAHPRATVLRKEQYVATPFHINKLSSGSVLCSHRGDVIRSENDPDGYFYQGVIQNDGNFVVYKQRQGDDNAIGAVWSSRSASSMPISVYLGSDGVLVVADSEGRALWRSEQRPLDFLRSQRGLLAAIERAKRLIVRPGSILQYPLLRLESNGNLVIYSSLDAEVRCDPEGVLWSALSYTEHPPPRCSFPGAQGKMSKAYIRSVQAERAGRLRTDFCSNYPLATNEYNSSPEGLTIILSTFDRFNLLLKQIEYYSKSSVVTAILVVWHKMSVPPPRSSIVHDTPIYFVQPQADSLNNRFVPSLLVNTDAVLIIDDDMKVDIEDIHLLYAVWLKYPRNIIGFFPRLVNTTLGRTEYISNSYDRKVNPRGFAGYAFMLTKVMLLHREALWRYTCDTDAASLLAFVDGHMNCEDIVMNGVVALHAHPDLLGASPPLYVDPMNRIGDYGKAGNRGLFKRSGHNSIRSTCSSLVFDKYQSLFQKNYSMQTKIVQRNVSDDGSTVLLSVASFSTVPDKLYSDCLFGTEDPEECRFEYRAASGSKNFVWG